MASVLASDRGLNHRQRAVLAAALSEPDTVFRIDTHKRLYRVAYATARSDLLELAELGFLNQVRRGRAFVFSPAFAVRAVGFGISPPGRRILGSAAASSSRAVGQTIG